MAVDRDRPGLGIDLDLADMAAVRKLGISDPKAPAP
jgi:hypothetical protein